MNEFTKHELYYLYEMIDDAIECYSEPDIAYDIRDKLSKMLDGHCNHDFRKTLAESGMYLIYMCHKCQERKVYDGYK